MKALGLICTAVALAVAPAAVAQDWSGSSVGFDLSASGLVRSSVSGTVVPARASGFTYTTASPNRSIDVDRSSDPQVGAGVSYSRLWDEGSVVWGLEGEFGYGGQHEFEVGPYQAGNINARGPGTAGSISKQLDTVRGELDLKAGLTLKASVGAKLGERVLVSLFAGPSVVQADVKTTQVSNYSTSYASYSPGDAHVNYSYGAFTEGASASKSETLVGGVLGAEARYRLTDRLTLRAQASVRRYASIDVRVDAGGGDTRLSLEPQMAAGSLGLLYRF